MEGACVMCAGRKHVISSNIREPDGLLELFIGFQHGNLSVVSVNQCLLNIDFVCFRNQIHAFSLFSVIKGTTLICNLSHLC